MEVNEVYFYPPTSSKKETALFSTLVKVCP